MKKAVFLDRDGTIIEDTGYAHKLEDLHIYPEAIRGLDLLKDQYTFYIITNQPGIEKGLFTVEDFSEFNNHLIKQLAGSNITIEHTYYCPHTGGCDCRKPSTKFINEITRTTPIDLAESWVIGDHPSDIEMGVRAGCRTVYLLTGHGLRHRHELEESSIKPTIISPDFLDAAHRIKEHENQGT